MKSTPLWIICLFFGNSLLSQAPNLDWVAHFPGTSYDGIITAVVPDNLGHVYIAGGHYGEFDIDPGPIDQILDSGIGANYIAKFDESGNLIWALQLPGATDEDDFYIGPLIDVDSEGNVYTAGYFYGTKDFDPGPDTLLLSESNNGNDIYICKFNPDGVLLWATQFECSYFSEPNAVSVNSSGDLLITGYFRETVDFDPGPDVFLLDSPSHNSGFVTKLTTNGEFLWAKPIAGSNRNQGTAIGTDQWDNVHVAGYFYDTLYTDPLVNSNNLISNDESRDVFILTFDSNGNTLWQKKVGGPKRDECHSIAIDHTGATLISGNFKDIADFDPDPGVDYNVSSTSSSHYDVFVCKLDIDGNFSWAKKMGGTTTDAAFSIAVDDLGAVYTTGYFHDDADFDPGPDSAILSAYNHSADMFISKFSSSGDYIWVGKIGGPNTTYGSSISIDNNRRLYTTGHFAGSVDFDPGPDTLQKTSMNGTDMFLHKMSWCLTPVSIEGDLVICPGESTTLSVNTNSTILWSDGDTTNTINVAPMETTSYSVVITQDNYYVCTAQTTVVVEPEITFYGNSLICNGQTTSLTAAGGTSYLWNTGDTIANISVSPTISTDYIVTVTSEEGCVNVDTMTIEVSAEAPPIATISGDLDICHGQGTLLTAHGGTHYSWGPPPYFLSDSTKFVGPNVNTTYTVAVFNEANCYDTTSVTVVVHDIPEATISSNTSTICLDDSLLLTAPPGNSYQWSTGDTISEIQVQPITASTYYTVIVTSDEGCINSDAIEIDVIIPAVSINGYTEICTDQSAALTVNGGLSYIWNTGETAQTILVYPLSTSSYIVTITDGNNCHNVDSISVTVHNAPAPVASVTGDFEICYGDTTTLVASGGDSYWWSNGVTSDSNTVSPNSSKTYALVAISPEACVDTAFANVNVTPLPPAAISGLSGMCRYLSANLTASGGSAYLWNTGATTATILVSPLETTDYSVTVTGDSGCTNTASKTMYISAPDINLTGDFHICEGQITLIIASGGESYLWNTGETSSSIWADPSITSEFSVTVTGANGCTESESVTISTYTIDASVTVNNTSLSANNTLADSYQWLDCNNGFSPIPGATNAVFIPTQVGVYALEISEGSCIMLSDCFEIVTTAIDAIDKEMALFISPNPTTGDVTIRIPGYVNDHFNNLTQSAEIELRDYHGKSLHKQDFQQNMVLDLSAFANGVYILLVRTEVGLSAERIVKNK